MVGSERVIWWEGKLYPDAGEVVGWRESRSVQAGEAVSWPVLGVPERPAGSAATARGQESNRERASRRARSKLRRYAVANRLCYMWVLTFAPEASTGLQEYDLARVKRQVASWVKRGLREGCGYRGAYVIGFERHKSGAWHVNVLLPVFVEHEAVARTWGRGNVWVRRWEGRQHESMRDAARRAAAYVSKYVSKEFEESGGGTHRYEVAQGFQLRVVRVFALSASGILAECEAPVLYRFDAPSGEAGRGPPMVWAQLGASYVRGDVVESPA